MNTATVSRGKTYDIVYIGIFAVLLAVCSWISLPFAVPFTLQTFGVFMALETLGGKRGTMAILVFLLMGLVGLPVFSGFRGGPGVLAGTTGGYIVGFVLTGFLVWGMEKLLGEKWKKTVVRVCVMLLGLVLCYAFGTLWFLKVYSAANGAVSIGAVLGWCVFPFVIPDLVKLGLAFVLARRVRKYVM
jgi:biotin transport system substrate-specific component